MTKSLAAKIQTNNDRRTASAGVHRSVNLRPALALIFAATILAGCAHAPAPKSLGCRPEPQWYVNDDKGIPSAAVLVCFRDDGVVTFASRRLTLEELDARTKPSASEAFKAVDKIKADLAKEIADLKKARTRAQERALDRMVERMPGQGKP